MRTLEGGPRGEVASNGAGVHGEFVASTHLLAQGNAEAAPLVPINTIILACRQMNDKQLLEVLAGINLIVTGRNPYTEVPHTV